MGVELFFYKPMETIEGTKSASRFNGIVLHLVFKSQRILEDQSFADKFRDFCVDKFSKCGCVSTRFSDNSLIGAFVQDDKQPAEMVACNCAYEIRDYLDSLRLEKKSDIVLKASINGGEVIIGNTINEKENEILGTAINISFQLLDNTSPMQVSLTRRVYEKISKKYSAIPRRPVALGNKTVSLFYLNTQLN